MSSAKILEEYVDTVDFQFVCLLVQKNGLIQELVEATVNRI